MALSLVVLTGFVGQISVVQLTLAGVAGFVISHFAVNFGIGFPLAPIIGTAVAVLLGMITAVSALRVRGVALAVVTLGGGRGDPELRLLEPDLGRRPGGLAGARAPSLRPGPRSPVGVPRPGRQLSQPGVRLGGARRSRWRCACSSVCVRRGDLGRRMLAVRSNERAAAAASINPRNVKLAAFAISALVAGMAGSLYAYNFGSVSADRFDAFTALSLIAFAYAGRHHPHLRSGLRRADLHPGPVPLRAGQVVRAQRHVVSPLRRSDPHRHPDPEPRGRRRRLLPAHPSAERAGPVQPGAVQVGGSGTRGGPPPLRRTGNRPRPPRRSRRSCRSPGSRSTSAACTRSPMSTCRSARASSSG